MNPYRVFVSYSHEDERLVEELVRHLEASGLTPMWDRALFAGRRFREDIQTYIAHAHVFLPVITEASSTRGWVHQEIGYAMALNIPVLPFTVGLVSGGWMMSELHAAHWSEDAEEWKSQLAYSRFDDRVRQNQNPKHALHQCAELAEERAGMMAEYADQVAAVKLGLDGRTTHAFVRQQGGLSSFHIPDETTEHAVWQERYGDHPKSPSHCEGQRDERLALDDHARVAGCRIIVNPDMDYAEYGPRARKVRLQCLYKFLRSMPADKVQVAFDTRMSREYSLTIVGDWFSSMAVSGTLSQGFRQTIFTRHAPSMMRRIERFDRRFAELLEASGWDAHSSRDSAMQEIASIISIIDVKTCLEPVGHSERKGAP